MTIRLLTTVLAATLAAAPAFGQSREAALALAAVDRAAAAIDVAQSQSERAREAEERGREQEQREKERADRQRDQESDAFDRARDQLDSERWERAIDGFDQVVALKGHAGRRRALLEGLRSGSPRPARRKRWRRSPN